LAADLNPPPQEPGDKVVNSAIRMIRIGVLAGEPIRLAGLSTVFEEPPESGKPQLVSVIGTLEELLADPELSYMVVDFNSSAEGQKTLETVKRSRPEIRQIVIGPDRDDELVLKAITAGARAYLDSSADPHTVRMAIEIVVSGSIWAPRRLLSRLIDRLLGVPGGGGTGATGAFQLTARECEVLDLILLARSNREIAEELGIEERTVKAHVGRMMKKTGAENRIELSIRALTWRSAQRPVEDTGLEKNP
jgi:DNA-binding NarL/FixJ family response regulator